MNLLGTCSSLLGKFLPIAYAVIGFGLLIVVHEFGHFIFCKMFNIHTPTFSIGFGPKIIERKIGETNFQVSALPLGGYVEISGLKEVGQGEQEHAFETGNRAFSSKAYWKKFLVLTGGVGFNIAFAYIALIALFMIGAPKPEIRIKGIKENSIAQSSGLRSGDKVISIDKYKINEKPQLLMNAIQKIQRLSDKDIVFSIKRGSDIKDINVHVPIKNGDEKKPVNGRLGIEFDYAASDEKESLPFIPAIKRGVQATNSYIYQTIFGIKMMFSKRSLKGAGGPVMILSESVKLARKGLIFLLGFLAIISINLAVINLIPIPIFDGGQLLFITIESIIGRELPLRIKELIHMASVFLILGLIIYLTFNDILMIFRGR